MSVLCDINGEYTVDVTWIPGTNGAQDIDVSQTDSAGNNSPITTVIGVDVDLSNPGAPLITFPDPNIAPAGTTDGTISGTGTP